MALKIWQDQRGQDTIEYALIVAFVATTAVAVFPAVAAVAAHLDLSITLLRAALTAVGQ